MLVLGTHNKDRNSTRDKANKGNPKVNRGCPPLTANRTSADCVENSLEPSVHYIPLGVYHTESFNSMSVFIGAGQPLQRGEIRDSHLAWVRPVLSLHSYSIY